MAGFCFVLSCEPVGHVQAVDPAKLGQTFPTTTKQIKACIYRQVAMVVLVLALPWWLNVP